MINRIVKYMLWMFMAYFLAVLSVIVVSMFYGMIKETIKWIMK